MGIISEVAASAAYENAAKEIIKAAEKEPKYSYTRDVLLKLAAKIQGMEN